MNELQQVWRRVRRARTSVLSNGGWFCRRVLLFVEAFPGHCGDTPLIFIATMMLVKTVATLERLAEAYKAADALATKSPRNLRNERVEYPTCDGEIQ